MSASRSGRGPGQVLIEGVRPVSEAIRAGRRKLFEIRVGALRSTPGLRELLDLARSHDVPVLEVTSDARGVSALAEPYPEHTFEEVLGAPGPRFLVALDRVTDVGNVGSIARSAEVAGATGLILEHHHAPPIESGALRASAGALEHLRVGRTPNLGRALEVARAEGVRVLVADPGGRPVSGVDRAILLGDLVWVFGSEDRGVRAGLRKLADAAIAAPQAGRIASLGVAAAAAYLLLRTAELRGVGA